MGDFSDLKKKIQKEKMSAPEAKKAKLDQDAHDDPEVLKFKSIRTSLKN